jgi:antitoxin (DNA-binding transcriptional repressor) of toxin-antitoxin stability system
MKIVDIHASKAQLSRLVGEAGRGEPFVIPRAGRPLVEVTAEMAPETPPTRRRSFLAGQILVPGGFDSTDGGEFAKWFTPAPTQVD